MTDGDESRLGQLFREAKDLSREQQRAFIDDECKDAPEMRKELEELLEADRAMAETPVVRSQHGNNPSESIGPYRLLQRIGEGGMGEVWMADQEKPVRRRVAVKLIRAGIDSKQIVARFEAERQALAMMDHKNIAKVLDAGTAEDGRPYFVMELVQGISFSEYCDKNKVSLRERLGLFSAVCEAVQHAHQKGIIHRDLKPSNVLVTLYDGKPVPKIIDFGLAKALEHQTKLTDKTLFTEFNQVVGTVQYMSPEQAEMNALDVDTRTDIYSLGVMLYELLTGSTPIERETIRQEAIWSVIERVRNAEPPKPSTRLSESGDAITGISEQRKIEPVKLQQILRGELDWIVMKALEKDRSRRYETAGSFANDVQRYLCGEAVEARPPSVGYVLRKTVWKHRVLCVSVTAVIASLLVGIIATTSQTLRANSKAREAENSERVATAAKSQAQNARDEAKAERDASLAMLAKNYFSRGVEASKNPDTQDHATIWFSKSLETAPKGEYAEQARSNLGHIRSQLPQLVKYDTIGEAISCICFSEDGSRFAVATGSASPDRPIPGNFSVYDVETLRQIGESCRTAQSIDHIRFLDNSRVVLGGPNGAIVWDIENEKSKLLKHNGMTELATSPGLDLIATAGKSSKSKLSTVRLWNVVDGSLRDESEHTENQILHVGFIDAGNALVVVDKLTVWRRWLDGSRPTEIIPKPKSFSYAYSLGSSIGDRSGTVAFSRPHESGAQKSSVDICNVAAIKPFFKTIADHENYILALDVNSAYGVVATGGRGRVARLWDLDTGLMTTSSMRHNYPISAIALSPVDRLMATGTWGGEVRIWRYPNTSTTIPSARDLSLSRISDELLLFGGGTYRSGSKGGYVGLLDARVKRSVALVKSSDATIRDLAFDTERRLAAIIDDNGYARLVDIDSLLPASQRLYHGFLGTVGGLDLNHGMLATANHEGIVKSWAVDEAASSSKNQVPVKEFSVANIVNDVLLLPNGDIVRALNSIQSAEVINRENGNSLFRVDHDAFVTTLAWDPGTQRVLSASGDGVGRLWNASTGDATAAPIETVVFERGVVSSASFAESGRVVALGNWSGCAQVFSTKNGLPLSPPVFSRTRVDDRNPHYVMGVALVDNQLFVARNSSTVSSYRTTPYPFELELFVSSLEAETWTGLVFDDGARFDSLRCASATEWNEQRAGDSVQPPSEKVESDIELLRFEREYQANRNRIYNTLAATQNVYAKGIIDPALLPRQQTEKSDLKEFPPLSEELVTKLSAAGGFAGKSFAICFAMREASFSRFCEEFSVFGFRPQRAEFYEQDGELLVSAIWWRSDTPWRFTIGPSIEELRSKFQELRAAGYHPIDVSARSSSEFFSIWEKPKTPPTNNILIGSLDLPESPSFKLSAIDVVPAPDGTELYSAVFSSQAGQTQCQTDFRPSDDGVKHSATQMVMTDIKILPPKAEHADQRCRYAANWRRNPELLSKTIYGFELTEHIEECKLLAEKGLIPVASSVLPIDQDATAVASVWHRRNPVKFVRPEQQHVKNVHEELAAKSRARALLASILEDGWRSVVRSEEFLTKPAVRNHLINLAVDEQIDVTLEQLKSLLEHEEPAVRRSAIFLGVELAKVANGFESGGFRQLLRGISASESEAGVCAAAIWGINKLGREAENLDPYESTKYLRNRDGQTLSIVRATSFAMGSPAGELGRDEYEGQHWRKIFRDFAISQREVTLSEFRRMRPNHAPNQSDDRIPVNGVSWYDAAEYCNWLSQHDGIPQSEWCFEPNGKGEYADGMRLAYNYLDRNGYRLPTEAEWECAARAGTNTSRFFGPTERMLTDFAWFDENSQNRPQPVATLRPNPLGLFDILGNVREWCISPLGVYPEGDKGGVLDLHGARVVRNTHRRVVRGGSYDAHYVDARSARRVGLYPQLGGRNCGFRVARTVKSPGSRIRAEASEKSSKAE